jgi:hypothetical protein
MPEHPLTLVWRVNAQLAKEQRVIARVWGKESARGEYVLIDIATRRYLALSEVERLAKELEEQNRSE